VSGIPVVEGDMTLVGIVTEKDLLGLLYGSQDIQAMTVEEFMTQPAVHFEADESINDICTCLLNVTFRRVPVTKDEKVVGIISRPDVIRCIYDLSRARVNE
jgi:CBS domain-containing protein